MANKFYWAQALDNTSPDYVYCDRAALSADKIIQRKEIVSSISRVTMSGSLIYNDGGVKLTTFKGKIVIELDTCQSDSLGRLAPLIACFDDNRNMDDSFIDSICSDILSFAQQINRSISPGDSSKMRLALAQLRKGHSRRKNIIILAVFFLICFIGVLIFKLRGVLYDLW